MQSLELKQSIDHERGLLEAVQRGFLSLAQFDDDLREEVFKTWDTNMATSFDAFIQLYMQRNINRDSLNRSFKRLSGPVFEYLAFAWLEKKLAKEGKTVIGIDSGSYGVIIALIEDKVKDVKLQDIPSISFTGRSLATKDGFIVIPDGLVISGTEFSRKSVVVESFYDATLRSKTKKTGGIRRFLKLLRDNKDLYHDFRELLLGDFIVHPKLDSNTRLIQVVTPDFDVQQEKKAITKGWSSVVRTPFNSADIFRLAANFLNEYASRTISLDRGTYSGIMSPDFKIQR